MLGSSRRSMRGPPHHRAADAIILPRAPPDSVPASWPRRSQHGEALVTISIWSSSRRDPAIVYAEHEIVCDAQLADKLAPLVDKAETARDASARHRGGRDRDRP